MTKSAHVPNLLRTQNLPQGALSRRCAAWQSRLEAWNGERRKAIDLYCGGRWSVVRRIANGNNGRLKEIDCWVVSAGYGLIRASTQIAPYSATFSPGDADSVSRFRGQLVPTENVEWWEALSSWRPSGMHGPRSLRDAFRRWPTNVHLFVLSPVYLDAISKDLVAARAELRNPEKLVIISEGKKRHGELNGSVITAPAALQSVLGGALVSLSARLASEVLCRLPVDRLRCEEVRRFVSRLLRRAKPKRIPQRLRRSDIQVSGFIRRSSNSDFAGSYTRLLQAYRDAGYACEMRRFKNLYQTARSRRIGWAKSHA